MPLFQDKVFVITGGSGGLGRAIAEAFLDEGAKVVLAARGALGLEAAAAELRSGTREVLAVPADITDQGQVETLVATTLSRFGRLDGLVNNAGISMRSTALGTTTEDFQRMLDLNLLAAVRCTRAAAPEIIKARGHIVNISSLSGKSASRFLGAYPASKFALTAYTQQLRLELAPAGVHVLLVCPGPIARDMPRTYGAEDHSHLPESARQPGGGIKMRPIDPHMLARRIVVACRKRRTELVVPRLARLFFALMQLSPRLGDYLVRRIT